MISEKYPYMGSYIFDAPNQKICKDYANDYFDVEQGKRSIRSYKKGLSNFQKMDFSGLRMMKENIFNLHLYLGEIEIFNCPNMIF